MEVEVKLIDEIIRRILSVTQPDRIILFGSAAAGQMNHDSDIDLLIIKNISHNENEEWIRIRKSLSSLDYPFDILIMDREKFEESKDVFGGIAYPASKYGLVIYEAA